MRVAPSDFEARLTREFNHRLRIRWSSQRNEWHIEQKTGRGIPPESYVSDFDDEAIRARDGYSYVLSVRDGDRMPCPRCGLETPVPVLSSAQITCARCKAGGKRVTWAAGWYPLEGDILIQHLRRLDPTLGYAQRIAKELDARNAARIAGHERRISNDIQASTLDHYNQLVGIPQWGYTGKTKAWIR